MCAGMFGHPCVQGCVHMCACVWVCLGVRGHACMCIRAGLYTSVPVGEGLSACVHVYMSLCV